MRTSSKRLAACLLLEPDGCVHAGSKRSVMCVCAGLTLTNKTNKQTEGGHVRCHMMMLLRCRHSTDAPCAGKMRKFHLHLEDSGREGTTRTLWWSRREKGLL